LSKIIGALAFCLFVSLAALAQTQAGTGSISGIVADSTGAIVPNATVTLTSKATALTKTATTSDEGIYRFVLLQPGQYSVKTSAANFGEQTLDVEVQVGRSTEANVTLGAANVSAIVEVTAEGVQTTQTNSDAVV